MMRLFCFADLDKYLCAIKVEIAVNERMKIEEGRGVFNLQGVQDKK
jgi:hypothetical protein